MNTLPRRALIVIDVQNEYFSGHLRIEHPPLGDSLPNVVRSMAAARAAGIPVVVVQHLQPAGAALFAEGTATTQLHPAIASRPHDLLLSKRQASVLAGTVLGDWLRERDIDTLTLVGYMTHNCGLSTALQASHEGWKVELLHDASGSLPYANAAGRASAEEIHRVTCVVLHSNFAAVMSTDTWLAALDHGGAPRPDGILGSHRQALAGR